MIFLPKPGKDTYSHPSSYRPISLSNYLLKTLERLCAWHVDQCVRLRPLHPQQHGFRCDRSTETAASCLVDYVERQIYTESHCLAAFLDIRSAFDLVTPQHIRCSLIWVGADLAVIGWYNDYLLHRNMTYHHCHLTTQRTTGMGFPQGASALPVSGPWP